MSSRVDEVERVSKDILAVRIIDHLGCSLNFCVNFQERTIHYKDGWTFSGRWINVETNIPIEKKEGNYA